MRPQRLSERERALQLWACPDLCTGSVCEAQGSDSLLYLGFTWALFVTAVLLQSQYKEYRRFFEPSQQHVTDWFAVVTVMCRCIHTWL